MISTHRNNKHSLDRGAGENKDAGAEYEARGNLLNEPQTRAPKQWQRDQDEIDIARNVCGKGGPDDGARHGGVAEGARVRVNLPVVVQRPTRQENGQDGGEIACEDNGKSGVDTIAITAKAVLPTSKPPP